MDTTDLSSNLMPINRSGLSGEVKSIYIYKDMTQSTEQVDFFNQADRIQLSIESQALNQAQTHTFTDNKYINYYLEALQQVQQEKEAVPLAGVATYLKTSFIAEASSSTFDIKG